MKNEEGFLSDSESENLTEYSSLSSDGLEEGSSDDIDLTLSAREVFENILDKKVEEDKDL